MVRVYYLGTTRTSSLLPGLAGFISSRHAVRMFETEPKKRSGLRGSLRRSFRKADDKRRSSKDQTPPVGDIREVGNGEKAAEHDRPGDAVKWKTDKTKSVRVYTSTSRRNCHPKTRGFGALFDMLVKKDIPGLRRVATKGASALSTPDADGYTLMHHAAAFGVPEMVAVLLDLGMPINVPNDSALVDVNECDGCTLTTNILPIHLAAWRGAMAAVKMMIQNGAKHTDVANLIWARKVSGESKKFELQMSAAEISAVCSNTNEAVLLHVRGSRLSTKYVCNYDVQLLRVLALDSGSASTHGTSMDGWGDSDDEESSSAPRETLSDEAWEDVVRAYLPAKTLPRAFLGGLRPAADFRSLLSLLSGLGKLRPDMLTSVLKDIQMPPGNHVMYQSQVLQKISCMVTHGADPEAISKLVAYSTEHLHNPDNATKAQVIEWRNTLALSEVASHESMVDERGQRAASDRVLNALKLQSSSNNSTNSLQSAPIVWEPSDFLSTSGASSRTSSFSAGLAASVFGNVSNTEFPDPTALEAEEFLLPSMNERGRPCPPLPTAAQASSASQSSPAGRVDSTPIPAISTSSPDSLVKPAVAPGPPPPSNGSGPRAPLPALNRAAQSPPQAARQGSPALSDAASPAPATSGAPPPPPPPSGSTNNVPSATAGNAQYATPSIAGKKQSTGKVITVTVSLVILHWTRSLPLLAGQV